MPWNSSPLLSEKVSPKYEQHSFLPFSIRNSTRFLCAGHVVSSPMCEGKKCHHRRKSKSPRKKKTRMLSAFFAGKGQDGGCLWWPLQTSAYYTWKDPFVGGDTFQSTQIGSHQTVCSTSFNTDPQTHFKISMPRWRLTPPVQWANETWLINPTRKS